MWKKTRRYLALRGIWLLLVLVFGLLAGFVYAVFWQPQFFLKRGQELAWVSPSFGYSVQKANSGTAWRLSLCNCQADVVGSVTLILSACKAGAKSGVVSLGVTPPLHADETQKALAGLVAKGGVSCSSSQDCTVNGVDISEALLEAGLATLPPDPGGKSVIATYRQDAQERAQKARRGLWWDWSEAAKKNNQPDPVLWRAERDALLPGSESTQISRAQAIGSYISQTLTLTIGILTGYLLSAAAEARQRARKVVRVEMRMETAASGLSAQVEVLKPLVTESHVRQHKLRKQVGKTQLRLEDLKRAVDDGDAEGVHLAKEYEELITPCELAFDDITRKYA